MKKILLPLLLFLTTASFGQSAISSVNSSALSDNNMIFTVGEIFVLPVTDPAEANSGLMGVLSRIEFFVTGIDDKLTTDDVSAYPNPTSRSLFFNAETNDQIKQVFIFDTHGSLVSSQNLADHKVDLSELQNGIYFIKTDPAGKRSFKIIKQ